MHLDVVQYSARRELDTAHREIEEAQVVDVPRGLDRIDQASLPLDGQYKYRLDGTGVTVFVLDSGIRSTHVEFEGRAPTCALDFYKEDCLDSSSHGTHVAGIIGGKRSGVAKNVTLVAVRVFGSDGGAPASTTTAGMDYILGQKKANPDTPMVVNMSFGGVGVFLGSTSRAVTSLVDAGIVVVAAAGNEDQNACLFSPASALKAIAVGASTYDSTFKKDRRAEFSNYGPCVDIFAYVV